MDGTRITAQASKAGTGIPPGRVLTGVTLLGVGALVVLVSLSLFRDLAARENERDALQTLVTLGRELRATPPAAGATLQGWLAERPQLERQLNDRRWLADGRRLLRHGYLFEWRRDEAGRPELGAWPWKTGRTGRAAFVLGPDGGVWRHDNRAGAWSGPVVAAPDPAVGAPSWQRLGR